MNSVKNRIAFVLVLAGMAGLAVTTTPSAWAQESKTAAADMKGLPEKLVTTVAPKGPVLSPLAARKSVKAGDVVTITGRVGGSPVPFVKERAVFTIVGDEIPSCSDHGMDACVQPWDYCCETKADIARHSATIQIMREGNKLLKLGMRGKAGIVEQTEVTVTGKVQQIDEKTLVMVASEIYVAPALPTGWAFGEAPKETKSPSQARAGAKVGDAVVVRGRIGGADEPVKPGVASFTLVGPEVAYDEKTEKPWAYGGASKESLAAASCEVAFVDDKGAPLSLELRGRRGIASGADVVVTGKVAKIEGGQMVIAADHVLAAKE